VCYARSVQPLADLELLHLLDRSHADLRALRAAAADGDQRRAAADAAREATAHWKDKLPRAELEDAIATAKAVEGRFGFMKPAWWRLRKVLATRYDFAAHAVRPSWTRVLEQL